MGSKKGRLLILNAAIILANVFLFSNGFLGLSLFSGTPLSISFAWTTVFISAVVFFKGNSRILKTKETRFLAKGIHSFDDCISALKEALHNGDVFDENIKRNIEQVERLGRKHTTIDDILLQKFSANEMSYQRFSAVIHDVESAVFMNVRSIINKISAFDEDEYKKLRLTLRQREYKNDAILQEKAGIYNEYINFVNNATKTNEEVLLKLDKMLLEISKYNSLEDGDINKLPAIIEMDELIEKAKLYK